VVKETIGISDHYIRRMRSIRMVDETIGITEVIIRTVGGFPGTLVIVVNELIGITENSMGFTLRTVGQWGISFMVACNTLLSKARGIIKEKIG